MRPHLSVESVRGVSVLEVNLVTSVRGWEKKVYNGAVTLLESNASQNPYEVAK